MSNLNYEDTNDTNQKTKQTTQGKEKPQTKENVTDKDLNDIRTAVNSKVDKQLEYNVDFNADGSNEIAALYTLTEDDNFIHITWNGGSISGTIIGNATSPTDTLIVNGIFIDSSDKVSLAKVTLTPNAAEFNFTIEKEPISDGIIKDTDILYKIGQGEIFYQTATITPVIDPKYEDTSLFEKITLNIGEAILGGTGGSRTDGQVKEHDHNIYQPGDQGSVLNNEQRFQFSDPDGGNTPTNKSSFNSSSLMAWAENGTSWSWSTQKTGGNKNLAAGIQIIKFIYVAKKAISYKDMKAA